MNDFHMNSLASDRRRDLMNEADASRLAHHAKRARTAKAPADRKPRTSRRLSLVSLFGRTFA